ncbi:unnamed protein product [Hydatigera taeniaeformis]|uniref:RRM domain-containing protein n=1 Tax=Hydatigena taeniaeformis TaxID=6205 RepID=A0A0R3X9Y7_HYDTA|nr:unnamed protein product [Hydatigera taeniaeformis]
MSGQATNTIRDPIQRESLAKRLAQRNLCSVRLSNLPKRYNYPFLLELVPDMVACRMFYDPIFRRPRDHAYIEFSSSECALKCVDRVNNKEVLGKSVRLYNLHWKTTKGEVARHFPGSTSINVSTMMAKGPVCRRRSGVANLMFGTVGEAIAAVDEKQGCVIRGRRISVHFCPKKAKSEITGLVVYGLKKTATEDEVRVLFPQANEVEMHPLGGFAVLRYAVVEDCKMDRKNALGAELKRRKLKIVFKFQSGNHVEMRSGAVAKAEHTNSGSLIFVKNLGRSATEEEAWIIVDLKLFPAYTLSVALISDVKSALELNSALQSGQLPLSPNLCAIVDADYVADITQVEVAAIQALTNRTGGRLQGKGVFSSEFLACLQPHHSIKEALTTFGIKKTTTRVLLVLLQTPGSSMPDFERINSHLLGNFEDPLTLHQSCNREKISQIYGISGTEFKGFGNDEQAYVLSILTRMSANLLMR